MTDSKEDKPKDDEGQTHPDELPSGSGPIKDVADGGDDDQFEG